jgi:hypothetical protein
MKLPAPPRDVPVIDDVALLAPKFRSAVARVIDDMRSWGYTPRVFETMRTPERQSYIYGFGRVYDDGRGIVTQAPTSIDTWHGFGLAADIICERALWNASPDFWHVLGCSARRHNLVWGGDWNSDWSSADERFTDFPHIQWGGGMRRAPSSQAPVIVSQKGIAELWRIVGAA